MKRLLVFATILLAFSAITYGAENPSSPTQLGELTPSNPYLAFGTSVAASGNTVVVYGVASFQVADNYVFVKPSAGWGNATESATLVASDGLTTFFGPQISGDTVIMNAEDNFVPDEYIFVRPAGGWSGNVNETAILTNSNCIGTTSISGDTIVTVTEISFVYSGCVFVKPAGGWKGISQPTATLNIPSDTPFSPATVAVNGDTIVVGLAADGVGEGTVYVYVKPSSGWSGTVNPTAKLIASNTAIETGLGNLVGISGDTIIATAEHAVTQVGEVFIFVKPAGGWTDMTETARLLEPQNGAGFASSIAISGDQIVVGAPYATVGFNQAVGAAYVFQKPAAGWKTTAKFNAELSSSDGMTGDLFGMSVSIGGGNFFVGSPNLNQDIGAAYVFGK